VRLSAKFIALPVLGPQLRERVVVENAERVYTIPRARPQQVFPHAPAPAAKSREPLAQARCVASYGDKSDHPRRRGSLDMRRHSCFKDSL
jgi:hypothetical protein